MSLFEPTCIVIADAVLFLRSCYSFAFFSLSCTPAASISICNLCPPVRKPWTTPLQSVHYISHAYVQNHIETWNQVIPGHHRK